MLLGFHGATTMTSDLETDVRVSREAGYRGLEVWAEKVDTYLRSHTLAELRALFVDNGLVPLSLNALVFVGFRGEEYPQVQQRCKALCEIAEAIGDYQRTGFGGWPWPDDGPVHGAEPVRFARHADGRIERPGPGR